MYMEDQKLTYKQVSALMGIPLGTIYGLVSLKRIPHIRLGKRFVRFSKAEIERWMKSHEIQVRGEEK
jgi:excisionase family DNA binding protein